MNFKSHLAMSNILIENLQEKSDRKILGSVEFINYGSRDDKELSRISGIIEERAIVRKKREWARADEIRDELNSIGAILKDSANGDVECSF